MQVPEEYDACYQAAAGIFLFPSQPQICNESATAQGGRVLALAYKTLRGSQGDWSDHTLLKVWRSLLTMFGSVNLSRDEAESWYMKLPQICALHVFSLSSTTFS